MHHTGCKPTVPDVVNAMGLAGTQDLRGVEVLSDALRILGSRRCSAPTAQPDRVRVPDQRPARPWLQRGVPGSSWDVGFYGVVQKDLRRIAHRRVYGPLNRVYCGAGSVSGCRAALESSLRQTVAETPAQVYPADGVCSAGDQMCALTRSSSAPPGGSAS